MSIYQLENHIDKVTKLKIFKDILINHRYPSGLSEHFQHIPRNLIAVYIMRLPNI